MSFGKNAKSSVDLSDWLSGLGTPHFIRISRCFAKMTNLKYSMTQLSRTLSQDPSSVLFWSQFQVVCGANINSGWTSCERRLP